MTNNIKTHKIGDGEYEVTRDGVKLGKVRKSQTRSWEYAGNTRVAVGSRTSSGWGVKFAYGDGRLAGQSFNGFTRRQDAVDYLVRNS